MLGQLYGVKGRSILHFSSDGTLIGAHEVIDDGALYTISISKDNRFVVVSSEGEVVIVGPDYTPQNRFKIITGSQAFAAIIPQSHIGDVDSVSSSPVLSFSIEGTIINVSWPCVPGATGYTLYYAPYPYSGPESIGSADVKGKTSLFYDLPVGASYYIAVKAYNDHGYSDYSNVEQFIITSQLLSPSVLSIAADGVSLTISWTGVTNASGYNLYFAPQPVTSSTSFSRVDVGSQTNQSFYLWENAAFALKVKAYDNLGNEGESSNTGTFIMGPPTPEWVDDDADSYREVDGDCDDNDFTVSPASIEICGDGIDNNCSGFVDEPFTCVFADSDFDGDTGGRLAF